jgi:hypothetical protein
MDTRTINLRDLPDDLVRKAKACAALNGVTLRDFVIRAINRAVDEDFANAIGMVAMAESHTAKKGKKKP